MTDEARRAKYMSRILTLLDHFYFYILPSYTCVERGGDVMSYFASSSSYWNTFLVSAFTISQKWKSISIFSIYAKKKLLYFIENTRNKEKRHKTLKKLLPKRFWCLISIVASNSVNSATHFVEPYGDTGRLGQVIKIL